MNLQDLHKFAKKEHKRLLDHYKLEDKSKIKYTMFAKLIEEVGEFSEAMLINDSLQRGDKLRDSKEKNKTNLDHELADVILVMFLLGEELNIDVEKALSEKIEKIKKRNYK